MLGHRCLAVLLCLVVSASATIPNPSRFKPYLINNRGTSGLPLSYSVPSGYFEAIPDSQRPHNNHVSLVVPACEGQTVAPDLLDVYEFQTEGLLTQAGINIYDAACWAIASTILTGVDEMVSDYHTNVLLAHKTEQFPDIRADATCKGVMSLGECTDPLEIGACGFCYGDGPTNASRTLPTDNAYFFRMISDTYSFQGTIDARCPELGHPWVWNDYRPVLGENAWANLIAPLQVAFYRAQGVYDAIDANGPEMKLALQILPALDMMHQANFGFVYYAPRNTYDVNDTDIGSTVSTENQGSLLAGLQIFLQILIHRSDNANYETQINLLVKLIKGVKSFLQSAYDPTLAYFRQGGKFNVANNTFTWNPIFAVDCQTWIVSVLGTTQVDTWFGAGTTLALWETTKKLGGYHLDTSLGWVQGVGYSDNRVDQVFSGEWSFGAINMLRVMNTTATTAQQRELTIEANYIRTSIDTTLLQSVILNGTTAPSVKYINKRYFIPFGWWGNPISAMSSTAWAVLVDGNFNPFYLGGAYQSEYPSSFSLL